MKRSISERELIDNYIRWENTEKNNKDHMIQALARDHQRKIKKVFEQNFHENIDDFVK